MSSHRENMADEVEESDALRQEYEWILREEVHSVLKELHGILTEACRRFPVQVVPGDDNLVKPEKFLLSCPNGTQHVKCMVTLMGDTICEADVTLRIHKEKPVPFRSSIYPDIPWKIQQIQDAGNHLCQALAVVESKENDHNFTNAQQVIKLLDCVMMSLNQGRASLALPKKKTLEELIKNTNMKAFKPTLPNDSVLSFYIQAQKLVLAVYHLYVNPSQKLDIGTRYQAECQVPWLNDTLAFLTLALQLCQQLRDKVVVFLQYKESDLITQKQVSYGE